MWRAPPFVLCHVPTPTRCTSHQPPPLASVPHQRPRFRASLTPQPLHIVNTPSSMPWVLRVVNAPTSACHQRSDLCTSSMPRPLHNAPGCVDALGPSSLPIPLHPIHTLPPGFFRPASGLLCLPLLWWRDRFWSRCPYP